MHGTRTEQMKAAAGRRQANDDEILALTIEMRRRPLDAELYYRRGNAHRRNGSLAPAVCDFNRAVSLNPEYAEAHFYKAITCAALGCRLEEAKAYRRFLECAGQRAAGMAGRVKRRLNQIEPRTIHGRVAAL